MHVGVHSIEKVSTSVPPRMGPSHELFSIENSKIPNKNLDNIIGAFIINSLVTKNEPL